MQQLRSSHSTTNSTSNSTNNASVSVAEVEALREEAGALREQLGASKVAAVQFQQKVIALEKEVEAQMKSATGHASSVRKSFMGSGIFGEIETLVEGLQEHSTSTASTPAGE